MIVLVDVEWYENGKHEKALTQLAAARVDEQYKLHDTFDSLACPNAEVEDYRHVAFNGASDAEFHMAKDPKDVLSEFAAWLKQEDVLCFWHESSAFLMRGWLPELHNEMKVLQSGVRASLPDQGAATGDMYKIARKLKVKTPYPSHCARNDVTVLACLLVKLDKPIEELAADIDSIPVKQVLSRKKMRAQGRAASLLLGKDINPIDGYRFVYNPKEKLLHRVDCPKLVWVEDFKGFGTLQGAASKYQRYCECCAEMLAEYHKRRKSLL